jgi:hypothetical protein
VHVVADRPVGRRVRYQPAPVGSLGPGDADLARQPRAQRIDLGTERGVEVSPPLPLGQKHDRLRLQRLRIGQQERDVVLGVLGQHRLRTGVEVDAKQSGRVHAHAGEQEHHSSVPVEAMHAGRQEVAGRDLEPRGVVAG